MKEVKKAIVLLSLMIAPALLSDFSQALSPSRDEMQDAKAWLDASLKPASNHNSAPFSFTYNGKAASTLVGTWKCEDTERKLDAVRTERTRTYTDPKTGLVVRCVFVQYADFPVVEWTLYLKNTGKQDTPILSNILPLDMQLPDRNKQPFVLHHNVGSVVQPRDFQPLETVLNAGAKQRFAGGNGKPTRDHLAFFNVEYPNAAGATEKQGIILAIGWPGQWAAEFSHDANSGLRVTAGQELTHFKLLPGEEVRTPLIAMQFWRGDVVHAQNLWRRWMTAHNMPHPEGKLVSTHYGFCVGNPQPSAAEEIGVLNRLSEENIKPDCWIIDAGWYPSKIGNWIDIGTWECDPKRFPKGLREVGDALHAKGIQFIVWFEPERVHQNTWLAENHPEWLLGGYVPGLGTLLNLGNPEAWKWVVERVDRLIVDHDIDVYRQDFGIDPGAKWRENDAKDRQGITEIKHVVGYLAFWDELLRRHPKLWIDICASGGQRLDLETLRRSVPLLRSDCWNDPITQQSQTYGLSYWLPYYGSGMEPHNAYWYRSCIFPASRVGFGINRKDVDFAILRRMIAEFRRVEPYLLGDYYPLTPYSLKTDAWIAWQFDRPEIGEGVVQTFRRDGCDVDKMSLKLCGLDPKASYTITNFDVAGTTESTGRELMERGLSITISERPGAAIVTYKKRR
jgi:alpha-galactosidase